MKNAIIPEYESFFSDKAIKVIEWSLADKRRIKSSKLYKAACRMECRYRKSRGMFISPDINNWWTPQGIEHATTLGFLRRSIRGINFVSSIQKGDA